VIARTEVGQPHEICRRYGHIACLSEATCLEYFKGAAMATCLVLKTASRVPDPVPLPPGYRPPQRYQRIGSGSGLWPFVVANRSILDEADALVRSSVSSPPPLDFAAGSVASESPKES
jgi:hypothetical protein